MTKTLTELHFEEQQKKFIERLKAKTVVQLAMSLETDLLHAQSAREDMDVYEYLTDYFTR